MIVIEKPAYPLAKQAFSEKNRYFRKPPLHFYFIFVKIDAVRLGGIL
jgi:hypothetical protein